MRHGWGGDIITKWDCGWNHKICSEVTTRLWGIKIPAEDNISVFWNLNCAKKGGIGSLGIHSWKLVFIAAFCVASYLTGLKVTVFLVLRSYVTMDFSLLSLFSSWWPPFCSPHSLRHNVYFSTRCWNQWFFGRVVLRFPQERAYPTRSPTWITWISCRLVFLQFVRCPKLLCDGCVAGAFVRRGALSASPGLHCLFPFGLF